MYNSGGTRRCVHRAGRVSLWSDQQVLELVTLLYTLSIKFIADTGPYNERPSFLKWETPDS